MNLEENIKDVISKKLEDGTVERVVEQKLEESIQAALNDLFGSWGDATKVIESQIKSVIVPYLETRDYSDYIVKLDDVLAEILETITSDNRKLLSNFKKLMNVPESVTDGKIKVSSLFEIWCNFVEENVDTSDLEVEFDDRPYYEPVLVDMYFEEREGQSWSSFTYGTLVFECEQDESMNIAIPLSKWRESSNWDLISAKTTAISSLRGLTEFEIFILSLTQNYIEIVMDETSLSDELTANEEPEPSW